ncbi:MAG: DUF2817 domain-containing protein [Bdellovibrionales bacterium]|nr:M14 family metallopeptidase [Bdellovibrionales bacterium]NQZ17973.1 DUF2817 domain-containing protein [Bdellovibrionales bacterium]
MKIFLFVINLLFIQSALGFYPDSYEQSRAHFIELAGLLKKTYPEIQLNSLKVPTQTGADLTTETIYIPQRGGAERLLIITSGIHGVEAYTGSAVQSQLLREQISPDLFDKMGLLIVHAVNPYGYHFKRRVSENNVDLNRNFSAREVHFEGKNDAYTRLNKFLNPLDKLKSTFFGDIKLFTRSLVLLVQYGKKSLTQAIVGGQYQYPKGIYFGGKNLEPNVAIIAKEFKRVGSHYKKIFHIDLHTGYGERGRLHYLINQSAFDNSPGVQKIFEGYELDTGSKEDFYETSGDFTTFTTELFPDKSVIPMTFEYGTLSSQTILGSFQSLKRIIFENQGFQYGYIDEASKTRTEEQFMDMFNPSSEEWRTRVLQKSRKELKVFLGRFSSF